MKLKQFLLEHSDFPTLLYIGGEKKKKKAKDEKQCSSCVQSGPEKTYEHIQVSTLTVSETVLCVYICVCRLETCRWGLHILQKQYHFLKNHPVFSELGPVLLEQLCVCGRALAVALKLIKTSLTLNCIFMPC